MIPPLGDGHGCLPAGRYLANLDEIEKRFVTHEDFRDHDRRGELWTEWQCHLAAFSATLGIEPRVWMAGSFVTAKAEPSDVDVFYGMPPANYDALTSDDLKDLESLLRREWCVRNGMRVDAYAVRLPDEAPVDDLRPNLLSEQNLQAFQSLGLYDEIWHRSRLTTPTRRGYLEVQL